jgi:hypothetical protein
MKVRSLYCGTLPIHSSPLVARRQPKTAEPNQTLSQAQSHQHSTRDQSSTGADIRVIDPQQKPTLKPWSTYSRLFKRPKSGLSFTLNNYR